MRTLLRPVLYAALLASPQAMAGLTGNAGAVTEYLFRGVEQSGGAAVQGGLDWSSEAGFYAGTWVSNISPAGGFGSFETDIYAGFAKSFGQFGVDAGLLYYHYGDVSDPNTLEVYAGGTLGPALLKVYYTNEYFGTTDPVTGDELEGMYVTASAALPLSDSLTLTPQIGLSSGDGPKALLGDEYTDYSLTLSKVLDAGFSFSVAVSGTDLDNPTFNAAFGGRDQEKVVIGIKKSFAL